ncbi:uncharacterized protein [Apteryx mantelli]|uniref:Fibronectin type-III domain-containing protein n=1 Tax=Apteryx mantelli TaxID=2696672 RepID=A0ABM4G5S4_9AVES
MVLRRLALAFLLVLAPLMPAQGQKDPGPKTQGAAKEAGTCQRPQWDQRLQLAPDHTNYKKNEKIRLSCPRGLHPSFSQVKCSGNVQSMSYSGSVNQDVWLGKIGTSNWTHIQRAVECIKLLQVVPGTLEVSATSIKLNWTCMFPDACQHMWAMCRLAGPSSPPCEAEEVTGEEMLQGQKGTFTCPPLQPFTVYSVTISLPPSMVLYTRLVRTEETVPDKVENLSLDRNTGLLRWNALPSCKGEILGYQLNISARRVHDGSFLEFKQLMVNASVTQYMPPYQRPGSKYMVAIQGLTAAGAGDTSILEFQMYFSGILWFVLSRKRKALPSKVEEEHYTELQSYENLDSYCVIKGCPLADDNAGKGGQAEELSLPSLP